MTESREIPPESALPREERSADWAAQVPREPDFGAQIPPTAPPTPTAPPIEPKNSDPIPFAPPPPVTRVEEVEAVRVTRAETRGPTIEVPGVARTPEPPPAPTAPPTAAAPTSASGTGPTFQQTSSMPPPVGQTSPPAAPPPYSPPPTSAADPAAPGSNKFWVMVCHLAYLIPGYVPGLVLTLVIWVWRRKRDAFLDDQAKEAINFQLLYAGIHLIMIATCVLCIFVPVLWVIGAVLCVVAAVSAADGKRYRYPYLFRLIT